MSQKRTSVQTPVLEILLTIPGPDFEGLNHVMALTVCHRS